MIRSLYRKFRASTVAVLNHPLTIHSLISSLLTDIRTLAICAGGRLMLNHRKYSGGTDAFQIWDDKSKAMSWVRSISHGLSRVCFHLLTVLSRHSLVNRLQQIAHSIYLSLGHFLHHPHLFDQNLRHPLRIFNRLNLCCLLWPSKLRLRKPHWCNLLRLAIKHCGVR